MAATTTEGRIAEALLGRLEDLVLAPPLMVMMPNLVFANPQQGMWLEAAILDAPAVADGLGFPSTTTYSGILQVTVVDNEGRGPQNAREVAGAVRAWFARGTSLYSDDGALRVDVTQPTIAAAILDKPYWRTPVSIRFQAFARE